LYWGLLNFGGLLILGVKMIMERPICRKCIYLYTTWDKNFPFGCKAMGIKSSSSPADVVRRASGHECLAYVEKSKKEP